MLHLLKTPLVSCLLLAAILQGCTLSKGPSTAGALQLPEPVYAADDWQWLDQWVPAHLQGLLREADRQLQSGQTDLALARVERALRLCPDCLAAYYRLAVIHLQLNRPDSARDLAAKALSLTANFGNSPDRQRARSNFEALIARSRPQ